MGAMFNSYAFDRMIEEYIEREGVSVGSLLRLLGAFTVSALIAGGVITLVGKLIIVLFV